MASLNCMVDDDGIAILIIDVPEKTMNLATLELGGELNVAVERICADAQIKGAILTSGKADFMAGGDIHGLVAMFDTLGDAEEVYRKIARPFSELLRRLETCGKPFVAAINGSAIGGGLEIALACHYRVVADLPKLVLALPEVTIGLIPGAGGTQRLPRLLGIKRAVEILLEGKKFSPHEALKCGLVDAVVAGESLIDTARSWILTVGNAVQPWDQKNYTVPGGAGFFDQDIAGFFNATATSISAKTQHNLPAPIALLTAVAHGTAIPMDAGLRIESRQFTKLFIDPTARNIMRTNFVSKGECDKLARRPKGIARFVPHCIGIIGAGLMGSGLAQVSADAGLEVVLIDVSATQALASLERIKKAYAKRVERGGLSPERAAAALARIRPTDDYAALSACELVIEAVYEDLDVKKTVYRKAAMALNPSAVLASNTSALRIGSLAEDLENPDRFIGLHFFSPVERMPLVEVIKGDRTSEKTLAWALDYIKILRKTPIIVNDSPGFFTTRVIIAYLFESFGMLGDGVPPSLIDNAAKQAGFAIGPLAMMDELALDLTYHAACGRREMAGSSWVEPYGFDVLQKFVVQLNRKGRRYGAGFYDYPDGQRAPWAGLAAVYKPLENTEVEPLKQRMLYIQALEAARAFEEGVIGNAGEADVGTVFGIGYPAHTGGVFSMIDTIGLPRFVADCDRLADEWGSRYRPSAWLRARAAKDERFYPLAPS